VTEEQETRNKKKENKKAKHDPAAVCCGGRGLSVGCGAAVGVVVWLGLGCGHGACMTLHPAKKKQNQKSNSETPGAWLSVTRAFWPGI